VVQHAKDFPAHLRALVKASVNSDRALRKLEAELKRDPIYRALMTTTQAIDLVQGGVKVNALPEEAWAVVNHRIATQRFVFWFNSSAHNHSCYPTWALRPTSSVAAVQQRDTDVLEHLAKAFNLSYTAFGSVIFPEDGTSAGTLTLSDAWDDALEPAPVTPTGEDSAPWQLFSGTIKATYDAHRGLDGADNIFVAPGIMTGKTGGNLRAGTSAVKPRLTYMGCGPGPQIRRSIGNSRATSSGITIMKENTDSIRSTNVCCDSSSVSNWEY
jgi:Gly-Xaa carboxypeptidase